VWGLALSMVEVLAGHLVIDGDRTAMMATTLHETRRPTPRNEGVRVTDAVESVFARALALDPRDRYASMAEFWRELESASQGAARAGSGNMPRAFAASAESLSLIPDLDVGHVSPSRVAVVPAITHAPSAPGAATRPSTPGAANAASADLDLEYDLPVAGVALEIDEEQLADARRSAAPRATSSSVPRLIMDSGPQLESFLQQPRRASSSSRLVAANPLPPAADVGWSDAEPAEQPLELGVSEQVSQTSRAPLRSLAPRREPTPAPVAAESSLLERVRAQLSRHVWPALLLIVASVLVSVAEQAYASEEGRVFTLGPFRAVWVSGVLMLAGVAGLVYWFLSRREPR
jgi:serine/threonine-protein kinase